MSYTITKIIYNKQNEKNNSYNVILKLNNKLTAFGFTDFVPKENDMIECELEDRDIMNEFDFKKHKLLLPNEKNKQIERIILLLHNVNYIETLEKYIKFGNDFWLKFIKYYLSQIDETLLDFKIIYEHVILYFDSIASHFIESLKSKGITRLSRKQLVELYFHPKFGINIDNWREQNLLELFKIDGFSINTVLKIAKCIKASIDMKTKIIIIYNLTYNSNGDSYIRYNYDKWINQISQNSEMEDYMDYIQKMGKDKFDSVIQNLIQDKHIIALKTDKPEQILYSKEIYDMELNIAKMLIDHKNKKSNVVDMFNLDIENINMLVDDYIFIPNKNTKKTQSEQIKDASKSYPLNSMQKQGIKSIFSNNISIIYGKAGTGKSSLLACLVDSINMMNEKINLYFLTPTSKAGMRLKHEVLKDYDNMYEDIRTIHSFNFAMNNDNIKLNKYNIFVIDETSMVDVILLHNFLESIKGTNYSIVFLGDIRQLPSIGVGDILNKLIQSNCFQKTELVEVKRSTHTITTILDNIIDGKMINTNETYNTREFNWIKPKDMIDSNLIKSAVTNNTEIIIVPTNNMVNSYMNDMREIKNPLIEGMKEYYFNGTLFRMGDPIIHTKNFNDIGLLNGMTGIIKDIESNIINVEFTNNNGVVYKKFSYEKDKEYIKHLQPSYLITIHKSQGSEYENMVVILTNTIMLNRNLLYTAISRAKSKITLISTEESFMNAIKRKVKRKTLLKDMFIYYDSNNNDMIFEDMIQEKHDSLIKTDDNYEIIHHQDKEYFLEKATNNIFYKEDNNIGKMYAIYNSNKDKHIKIKYHNNNINLSITI